ASDLGLTHRRTANPGELRVRITLAQRVHQPGAEQIAGGFAGDEGEAGGEGGTRDPGPGARNGRRGGTIVADGTRPEHAAKVAVAVAAVAVPGSRVPGTGSRKPTPLPAPASRRRRNRGRPPPAPNHCIAPPSSRPSRCPYWFRP